VYQFLQPRISNAHDSWLQSVFRTFQKILFKDCNLDLEQNSIKKCSTDEDIVNDDDADVNCSICLQPAGELSLLLSHRTYSAYRIYMHPFWNTNTD
jgi:hypothetical protein